MSMRRYDLPREKMNFDHLKLLYVSTAKYGSDWYSALHSHKCSEIFYIVSGRGDFHVESAVFPVHADQLVIINSNVEHTESSIPQEPMEYIVMGVEGCDLLFDDNDDCRYSTIDCCNSRNEILNYMQMIISEMEEKDLHYSSLAHNLLEIFFIKLLRHKSFTFAQSSTSKFGIQCSMIKHYLDNHYKENITLDTLAGISYMNKFSLAHAFKEEYGVSPINYLVQRRIAESRYLLGRTNYRIYEIASMLGFSSSSYFTQTFTRIEGISPRDYRRQMQDVQKNQS